MALRKDQPMMWPPRGCAYVTERGKLSSRQVGLIPGEAAPLLELDLPDRLGGFAREQVGFRQMRDALGHSALHLHPFVGSSGANAWRRVVATVPDQAAGWRERTGRAILPDYLALPAAPDLWVLAGDDARLIARLGPDDGFAAPLAVGLRQLRAALETGDAPRVALLLGDLPDVETLLASRAIPVVRQAEALADHGIDTPVRFGYGELACDLRRAPGLARRALARRLLPWRWPLIAALLAAGFWSVTQVLETDALHAEADLVAADTLARVRDSFLPEGPVLDIRVQVSRALADARAGTGVTDAADGPLDLLAKVARGMVAAGATPESLAYSRSEALVAVSHLPDFAAVEALAEALRADGLQVEVHQARADAGSGEVRAELRLRPAVTEAQQ